MTNEYVFKLEVSGRPETSGIRVRSLNPVGLYGSCKNQEALKSLVCVGLLQLAHTRMVLGPQSGEALTILDALDWDAFLKNGVGEVTITAIPDVEIEPEEYMEPVRSEYPDAVLEVMQYPDGKSLFIVRDQTDIDQWILRCLGTDIQKLP